MSTSNRADLITKTQKVVGKRYKPFKPPADRGLLEHLLYACCLENSMPDAADEAFAKLQEMFFDWNEVRVTTVTELSQVMTSLSDPAESASRIRKALQGVFEKHYTFDIEFMKKQNLGKSVKELQELKAFSEFCLAYFTQHGLGGHSIPVNSGVLDAMLMIGVITEKEHKQWRVPGLERSVPKTKGAEFASLIHQLGVEYRKSPNGTNMKKLLTDITPDAKERMKEAAAKEAQRKKDEEQANADRKAAIRKAAAAKRAAEKKAAAEAAAEPKKKPAKKQAPTAKAPTVKKVPAKKAPTKKKPPKKATPTKKAAKAKQPTKKKKTAKKSAGKKTSTKKLTKKKPR